ncbi:prolyl-trna synthetase [Holotrichia oblita]|nr:prolyl-trna synthetase [Holotrichia oblita]
MICAKLAELKIRAQIDNRDYSAGWKFNEWEMKGVPLRIEFGPRDLSNGEFTVVRRDLNEKTVLKLDNLSAIDNLLKDIQKAMLDKSKKMRDGKIKQAENFDELNKHISAGNFVKAGYCGCRECEDKIKEQTAATARVMPLEKKNTFKKCVYCGKESVSDIIFARAY